jgi:hypothetical protein
MANFNSYLKGPFWDQNCSFGNSSPQNGSVALDNVDIVDGDGVVLIDNWNDVMLKC